jgi:hypothetical protein
LWIGDRLRDLLYYDPIFQPSVSFSALRFMSPLGSVPSSLGVRQMSVRDVLKKERRHFACIGGAVALAALVVPLILLRAGLAVLIPWTLVPLWGAYIGIAIYRNTAALRCPRCDKSLGLASIKDFWFTFPDHLDRCPTCDLDLDRELETIQTI